MEAVTVNETKKSGFFSNLANPIIRKMEKKADFAASATASYGGIAMKTLFFLLITLAAAFAFLALHGVLVSAAGTGVLHAVQEGESSVYDLTTTVPELIIVIVATLIALITPFLAFFIRSTIPVTGTLYTVSQGIMIGFITTALATQYKWLSLLAAVLTAVLVGVMLFIYAKRIIKVNATFRKIIIALFATIVISGIVFFVLNLIPFTRNLMTGINEIVSNPIFSIILSVIFIIIAALFMLADFDAIERCVENGMDKKYEWMAAWGLAYTILYVYFKILRLLIMAASKSKSRN